jgi:dihydropteroate synthase
MYTDGACIIDVGGESTRPGASAVNAKEQIRRTVPVIASFSKQLKASGGGEPQECFISIDTTQASVAESALNAGAHIINDVSAGLDDPHMLPLAASRSCGLILMHRLTQPDHDSYSDRYVVSPDYDGDVVASVKSFLDERCAAAISAGVAREAIVIDPGLGFGKSVSQNYELIAGAASFLDSGFPMLSAASRKSFLVPAGSVTPPNQRLAGSVGVSILHYSLGVRLFRVHDVAAHRQALHVAALACQPNKRSAQGV